MSADLLRQASEDLREQAQVDGVPRTQPMHSTVARAIADLFDAWEDSGNWACECGLTGDDPLCEHEAVLVLARAVLKRSA